MNIKRWFSFEKSDNLAEWDIRLFGFLIYAKDKERARLYFSERNKTTNKTATCFDINGWRVFFRGWQ